MGEKGLLSVIIPVYKVEPYLKRCIDSVRKQTYEKLQIILVDDGSPDNCGKICDEYTELDSRIIAVHQENEGLSGARNSGLLFAKGEYISFVDSDDWLHPRMYEVLMNMINEYKLDIARCSVCHTDGHQEEKILPSKVTPNVLVQGSHVFDLYFSEFLCKVVWNAVYKRSVVEGILSPIGCCSEDNYVSGRYLYRCKRLMITNQCLYYYYKNPHSITRGGHKRLLDICICTQKLRDDLICLEGMNQYKYIKNLNAKLARELFHFVRGDCDEYRTIAIKKEQKKFIDKNLDFFRRIRFDILIRKKHIRQY